MQLSSPSGPHLPAALPQFGLSKGAAGGRLRGATSPTESLRNNQLYTHPGTANSHRLDGT